jgi:hypothetical protein
MRRPGNPARESRPTRIRMWRHTVARRRSAAAPRSDREKPPCVRRPAIPRNRGCYSYTCGGDVESEPDSHSPTSTGRAICRRRDRRSAGDRRRGDASSSRGRTGLRRGAAGSGWQVAPSAHLFRRVEWWIHDLTGSASFATIGEIPDARGGGDSELRATPRRGAICRASGRSVENFAAVTPDRRSRGRFDLPRRHSGPESRRNSVPPSRVRRLLNPSTWTSRIVARRFEGVRERSRRRTRRRPLRHSPSGKRSTVPSSPR